MCQLNKPRGYLDIVGIVQIGARLQPTRFKPLKHQVRSALTHATKCKTLDMCISNLYCSTSCENITQVDDCVP